VKDHKKTETRRFSSLEAHSRLRHLKRVLSLKTEPKKREKEQKARISQVLKFKTREESVDSFSEALSEDEEGGKGLAPSTSTTSNLSERMKKTSQITKKGTLELSFAPVNGLTVLLKVI
jgi:hypothetical protein